jgi:anti-sigma factor RsiW
MSCEAWKDTIDAYADGEMAGEEGAAFHEHIERCAGCAREVLDKMELKRATRAAAMRFTPSREFRQRIQESIAPRRRRFAFLMSPALALAVALVLVVAVASVLVVRQSARRQAMAELLDMHVAALASAIRWMWFHPIAIR